MVSMHEIEERCRALISQMERAEAAMAGGDLDAVEACASGVEEVLAAFAQVSAQFEQRAAVLGEESVREGLRDLLGQALVRAERNRAHIESWIGRTQEALSHLSRGGRAVNGYAASVPPDSAEFLSARG
jgi:hypothetical protein